MIRKGQYRLLKFLIVQFSQVSCYFLPLDLDVHSALLVCRKAYIVSCQRPSFIPIQENPETQQIYLYVVNEFHHKISSEINYMDV